MSRLSFFNRRAFVERLAVLPLAALLAAPAAAQSPVNFPTHNITLVVPFPAGGPPDVIARILAPALQNVLGKPVIVENRAGAAAAMGAASVARAAPDGHTLLMIDPAFAVAQNIIEKPGFDPLKDFAFVAPTMRSYMTLVVHPSVPAKTLQEFIALAKAKPGDIKYGTSGVGSPPYLGALAFLMATGVDLTHVPYRGAALALNDAVGGHISAVFVSQATAGPQVQAGQLRVLGVYGDERLKSLPDVPTFKEGGIDTPIANQGTWFGVAAPAGTPAPIVARLNAAFNQALRDPATKALLEKADFVNVEGGTAEQMRAIVEANVAYWRDLFQKAGVKPE